MRGCIGGDAARLNGRTARSSLATYDRTAAGTARFTATRDPMRKKNRPYERRQRLAASRRNKSKTRKSKSKNGVKSPKKPPLVHDAGARRVLENGL